MAGLSLSLLLVVGLVTWAVLRPDTYTAPRPDPETLLPQPALAAAALRRLETGVRDGDLAAVTDLAPAQDEEAAGQLRDLITNAAALRVRDFTLRYVAEAGAVAPDGTWQAAVDATWRFAGFDDAPARAEVLIGFMAGSDQVTISSIGGGDRRTPIWMSSAVAVRRTATTLVLAAGGPAVATRYERRAVAAVPVVRRLLRAWRPRLVVEVPGSLRDLGRALDADPGDYAAVAAVTTSPDGSIAPDAPIHVFVNPMEFERLKPTGAQVVMSHEATHVATRAPGSSTSLWLLEGFADYVALRDIDLPLSITAGQIIAQVRRRGAPATLPGPVEFDTDTTHLGAAYEAAWIACRVLVERGGEQALVGFYNRAESGLEPGVALRRSFGWSEQRFVEAWRRELVELAS